MLREQADNTGEDNVKANYVFFVKMGLLSKKRISFSEINFFLVKAEPFWKGFPLVESKQEVTKVACLNVGLKHCVSFWDVFLESNLST